MVVREGRTSISVMASITTSWDTACQSWRPIHRVTISCLFSRSVS